MKPLLSLFAGAALLLPAAPATGQPAAAGKPPASLRYLPAKAYHLPPETTTEESGYFSLCEGKNGRIYVGTAAYGRDSYLVEFDLATEKRRIVLYIDELERLPLVLTGVPEP